MSAQYFFMLERDRYGFQKKCAGTRYAELVFWYPLGCAGHVVHSGTSGARKIDTLFFMFGWEQFGFNKKRARTRYVELMFLHPVGSAFHLVHSIVFGE
jgi:hypothetical protein